MLPDPYRVAYESALKEVTEIATTFEQLRVRKSQLETLVTALRPVFATDGGGAEVSTSPNSATQAGSEEHPGSHLLNEAEVSASEEKGFSYLDVPNPLPENDGDPFQRRVKNAFRFKGLATQRS